MPSLPFLSVSLSLLSPFWAIGVREKRVECKVCAEQQLAASSVRFALFLFLFLSHSFYICLVIKVESELGTREVGREEER